MKRYLLLFLLISIFHCRNAMSQDTLVLQPGPESKDAIINTHYTQNFGDYPNNFALGWTHSGAPFKTRSLMDFDLSALPEDAYIVHASLSLFFAINQWNPGLYQTPGNQAHLRKITTPWDEMTVNWDSSPEFSTEHEVFLPESTYPDQDYPDIDVTDLIRDEFMDPGSNFGMILMIENEYPLHGMAFASSDYTDDTTKRPVLEVIYIMCVPPSVTYEYEVEGFLVSFTGISPSALTWHWDFGDGDTSVVQDPEHTYAEQGFYNVCLTVTDTCYFAEYCEVIEICSEPPVPAFNYVAQNLTVYFDNLTTMASGYHWDFGDGDTSDLANPVHTYAEIGSYQVCLTAWNGCGADSLCQVIDLCILPNVSFYYYFMNELEVQFYEYCMMAEQFYWDFGDGTFSYYSNPYHIYEGPGEYIVCLTAYNQCGFETACDWIYLDWTGIVKNDQTRLLIYPNPATDHLNIRAGIDGIVNFDLVDSQGRVVISSQLDFNQSVTRTIDVGNLTTGIYFARLTGDNYSGSQKIIIVK